jgi:hypothetical protein
MFGITGAVSGELFKKDNALNLLDGGVKAFEALSNSPAAVYNMVKEGVVTIDQLKEAQRLQKESANELKKMQAERSAYIKRGRGHKMVAATGGRQLAGGGRARAMGGRVKA